MRTAIARAAALGIAGILFAPMSAMAQPNEETDARSAAAAGLVSVADLPSEVLSDDASEGDEGASGADGETDVDGSDIDEREMFGQEIQVVVDGSRARFTLRSGKEAARKAVRAVAKARATHCPLGLEEFSELVLVDEAGVAQAFLSGGEKTALPEGMRTVTFVFPRGAFSVNVAFPARSWAVLTQIRIDGRVSDYSVNLTRAALGRIMAEARDSETISYADFAALLDWLEAKAGVVHNEEGAVSFIGTLFVPGIHEIDFGLVSVKVEVPEGTDYADRDGLLPSDDDVAPELDDRDSDRSDDREGGGSRGDSDGSSVPPVPSGRDSSSDNGSASDAERGAAAQGSAAPAGFAGTVRVVEAAAPNQLQASAKASESAKPAEAPHEEPKPEAPSEADGHLCLPSTCVKGGRQNLASSAGGVRQGVGPMGVALATFGGLGLGMVIMKRKEIDAKVDRVGTAANTDCVIMKRSAEWRFPRG